MADGRWGSYSLNTMLLEIVECYKYGEFKDSKDL